METPRRMRRAAHAALRAAGASVAVVHGLDAAIDQLEQWKLVNGVAP